MNDRLTTSRQDARKPATAERDFARLFEEVKGDLGRMFDRFRERLYPGQEIITPATERPVLRLGELALVYTANGAVTLYLPSAKSSDAGRVAAFLKQFENFHVNIQTTDGSLINGSYVYVHGLTQLGMHELLWDGVGWWFKEPAARVRVHDTSFLPLGLWQFTDPNNLLADTSGNGYDLTVETGTSRSGFIWGDRGGFYFDGLTALWYNVSEAALRLTGDMSFFCLWSNHTAVNSSSLVTHGDAGELETGNLLYRLGYATYPDLVFTSESGAGVDASHSVTSLISMPGQIAHVGFTRTSGVVQFWHNGVPFGAASAALTTPTGGSTGRLRLGGSVATRANGMMTSAMLLSRALSAAEVRRAYNMTLGLVLGFVVEVGDA